ncbi:hypothetical protein SHELI_v1c03370 [Spiroplasma helicoides]|uniref:ECF transporter S component n=1 Tax=Spiroplasma helicoides TaxID=216938 RepID=A0A1B3SK32_9MOLU|nr:hypothetical protein [Spiroplasma helicoides]AOG60292.1 hypothetical protein SHELI_v1c03370 [Spiroplasma helicoides]
MKKTDKESKLNVVISQKVLNAYDELDNIDLDYEISKLSKTNRHARFKSETLNITLVSLLLSMSTAVSLINVVIPLGITGINVGFSLKYFIIAISFQVVGLYWGMIIGLLDGLLQFIIYGLSPLFRFTSSLGLVLWVFLFWFLFKKLFNIYEKESIKTRSFLSFVAGVIILIIQPFVSSLMGYFRTLIEFGGDKSYSFVKFMQSWISLMIFDLFAIVLFCILTYRIQLIISKIRH